jgi:hypothetical protein
MLLENIAKFVDMWSFIVADVYVAEVPFIDMETLLTSQYIRDISKRS